MHYFINFLCFSFNLFIISFRFFHDFIASVFYGLLSSFSFLQRVIFHLFIFPRSKTRIFFGFFPVFLMAIWLYFIFFLNFPFAKAGSKLCFVFLGLLLFTSDLVLTVLFLLYVFLFFFHERHSLAMFFMFYVYVICSTV